MTDLISREAAIAVLKAIPRDDENDSYASGYNIGLRDCIEELAKVPSAESELQEEIADLQSQLESWQHAAQYPRD